MYRAFEKVNDQQWIGIRRDGTQETLRFFPKRLAKAHLRNADGEIVAKVCGDCGAMKPIESFPNQKTGFGGKMSYCKLCRDHRMKMRALGLNKDGKPLRPRKSNAKREVNDKGEVIAKQCPGCGVWKDAAEFDKQAKSSDGLQVYCKTCHAGKRRDWAKRNPEALKTMQHNRRAKERALPHDLTSEEWERILFDVFDGRCPLTGEETDLHLEHAIPIAIGHGGTVHWNVYPCAGWLNVKKSDRNLFEVIEQPDVKPHISEVGLRKLLRYLSSACEMTVEEYRQFYAWTFENPRLTVEEIEKDGGLTSIELWRRQKEKERDQNDRAQP